MLFVACVARFVSSEAREVKPPELHWSANYTGVPGHINFGTVGY